jgi:protein-S-isoprenylcysteine O-methyltransferase Ste14
MNQSLDTGSFWLIVAAILFFLLASLYDFLFLHLHIHSSPLLTFMGISFLIFGIIIRIVASRTLGKQFSVFVRIQQKHHLITTGLYRYVRHPIYSVGILTFIGFILVMNSLVGLIVFFIVLLPAILYRISVEETVLVKTFGKNYAAYKKTVGGLIPKL